MTLRDLLELLKDWPLDYEVSVAVGAGRVAPILGVTGAAGARIDGADSVTLIEVAK